MNAERVCYVDSSAIVKLVVPRKGVCRVEALSSWPLSGVERTRRGGGGPGNHAAWTRTLRTAREVLSRIEIVRINAKVLSRAATMEPADLRTLDAIHLATASLFAESLHRFVCYDGRLASAAKAGNWTVVSPD